MSTIITIANQKGGVGKTTTAVTLSHGLAAQGYITLVIDLDPQGHIAYTFGIDKSPGLYNLLVDKQPIAEVIIRARPNLDIIPGDKSTSTVKQSLAGSPFPAYALTDALNKINRYDVIIVDTAPSLDILHIAALMASHSVIIATRLDAMAIDGVNELLKSMSQLKQRDKHFENWAVLPTFYERVTNESGLQLQKLAQAFGRRVLPPIPQDVKARECSAYGKTLYEYSPTCPAMTGFTNGGGRKVGGYDQVIERIAQWI